MQSTRPGLGMDDYFRSKERLFMYTEVPQEETLLLESVEDCRRIALLILY
jgi:hypothetical protein